MIDPKYKIESEDYEKFGIRQTHTVVRNDAQGCPRTLKVFFGHDGRGRANKLVELLKKNDEIGDDTELRASERKLYFNCGVLVGTAIGVASAFGAIFLTKVFT